MAKRLALLFAALMVLGFVVAGCGDDDDDGGGSSDNAAETEKKTDTGGSSGADVAGSPQAKQAVESCKQSVNSAAQLKADTKADLVEICEKAAGGDEDAEEAVRKAAKDVCKKIVEDTVPAGNPGREQALAACDQSGP